MSQIDNLSDADLATLRAERDAANAEVVRLRAALRRIASGDVAAVGIGYDDDVNDSDVCMAMKWAARWGLGEVERTPWEDDEE